jgi:hypothetical protein
VKASIHFINEVKSWLQLGILSEMIGDDNKNFGVLGPFIELPSIQTSEMRFAPQARSLILLPLMQLIPDIAF